MAQLFIHKSAGSDLGGAQAGPAATLRTFFPLTEGVCRADVLARARCLSLSSLCSQTLKLFFSMDNGNALLLSMVFSQRGKEMVEYIGPWVRECLAGAVGHPREF